MLLGCFFIYIFWRMKNDKNNFEEINTKEEFYIHDSIIHELRFDYQQKSIDFLIEPEVENGEIKHIIFGM